MGWESESLPTIRETGYRGQRQVANPSKKTKLKEILNSSSRHDCNALVITLLLEASSFSLWPDLWIHTIEPKRHQTDQDLGLSEPGSPPHQCRVKICAAPQNSIPSRKDLTRMLYGERESCSQSEWPQGLEYRNAEVPWYCGSPKEARPRLGCGEQ
jgi:hypothetical protein